MIESTIKIRNRLGLHARAAAKLVHVASSFKSDVRLKRDHHEVNGKSILGLLILAATPGTSLTLVCDGDDEREAAAAIEKLVDDRFDEDSELPPAE